MPGASPHKAARVAVTGVGPVSSVGIGREDFLNGLREGRRGTGPSERLSDTGPFPHVAECWDFAVEDYLASKKTYLDRCSELALAACALALEDADLPCSGIDSTRLGLCLGTAFGCLESMSNHTARVQTKGLRFGSPMIFTHAMANSPTALATIEYRVQGPVATFCSGSISGACALEFAVRRLQDADADYVMVGGCDALSTALLSGLPDADELGPDFVPGEGACVLMLEPMEKAVARKAHVVGEIVSVGLAVSTEENQQAALEVACKQADLMELPAMFAAPAAYGHTFGASMVLDICAGLGDGAGSADATFAVTASAGVNGGHGPSAAVIVRRAT